MGCGAFSMRKRYIESNGHWVPIEQWRAEQIDAGPMVIPDISPYQSMITGEEITSRSKHREHLREHGCVEIGNDALKSMEYYQNIGDVAPQQRHELIKAQIDAMSHDQFRKAIKADVDRVKWNSRED
jgi:hypothetical protein